MCIGEVDSAVNDEGSRMIIVFSENRDKVALRGKGGQVI